MSELKTYTVEHTPFSKEIRTFLKKWHYSDYVNIQSKHTFHLLRLFKLNIYLIMNNKELYDKIKESAEIINKKSMKGSSNYILNPKIAEFLFTYFELEEKRKNRDKKINKILNEIPKNI